MSFNLYSVLALTVSGLVNIVVSGATGKKITRPQSYKFIWGVFHKDLSALRVMLKS